MLYHQSNILEEEENSLEVLIKGRWSQKTSGTDELKQS